MVINQESTINLLQKGRKAALMSNIEHNHMIHGSTAGTFGVCGQAKRPSFLDVETRKVSIQSGNNNTFDRMRKSSHVSSQR